MNNPVVRLCHVCFSLQELHTAAEPLRQNEVKISVLKNVVWQKTLEWIRATSFAQTGEIPSKGAKSSSEGPKSKKNKGIQWEPDELWTAIQQSIDSEEELVIESHHFVESTLIPKFVEGMPVDVVHQHQTNAWNTDVQDL